MMRRWRGGRRERWRHCRTKRPQINKGNGQERAFTIEFIRKQLLRGNLGQAKASPAGLEARGGA